MSDIHHSAADGYSVTAATYEKVASLSVRSGYWLCGDLRLSKGRTALDLGSGTGKFCLTFAIPMRTSLP